MPREVIAVEMGGKITVHATSADGVYATFCGLDGDDTSVGQKPARLPHPRARIDCPDCHKLWNHAGNYRRKDFTEAIHLKGGGI